MVVGGTLLCSGPKNPRVCKWSHLVFNDPLRKWTTCTSLRALRLPLAICSSSTSYPPMLEHTLEDLQGRGGREFCSTQHLTHNKRSINIGSYYNLETLQMTKRDRMDIFVVFPSFWTRRKCSTHLERSVSPTKLKVSVYPFHELSESTLENLRLWIPLCCSIEEERVLLWALNGLVHIKHRWS